MKRRANPPQSLSNAEQVHLPKYTIGVVSRLLSLPPQMLRRYEEAGLLEPARQAGKNRLYSDYDVSVLQEIAELADQGVNAVGIRYILQMRKEVHVLQQEVKEAREAQLRAEKDKQHTETDPQHSSTSPIQETAPDQHK